MIEYLDSSRATFVTNGIGHIKRLLNKGLRAYMIGGLGKPVTESTVGAEAVNHMKMFNFSKCFLEQMEYIPSMDLQRWTSRKRL